jgi:hypothetical protein
LRKPARDPIGNPEGRRSWRSLAGAIAGILIGAAASVGVAGEGELVPLGEGEHGWIGTYVGKIAIMSAEAGILPQAETCTAVAVHAEWILTAAHCVHAKRAEAAPWTPEHFAGMYPLDRVIFRLAPIGQGPIYRVVDYRKSPAFPDPNAALDDWIFLRLDRAIALDAARLPVVETAGEAGLGRELRIVGFTQIPDREGRLDIGASNMPRISAAGCRLAAYRHVAGRGAPGLVETDCIPAVNPGLSGAPMLAVGGTGAGGRPAIAAIQMGAGPAGESFRRVPVLVGAERFVATYRAIVGTSDPEGYPARAGWTDPAAPR